MSYPHEHDSKHRDTMWSITYFPPSAAGEEEVAKKEIEEFVKRTWPPGWKLSGQVEQCPTSGKYHYQGYIKTPQIRARAVWDLTSPAKIIPAINKKALENYTHKEDTRVAQVADSERIPNMFEYSEDLASRISINHIQIELAREDLTPTEFGKRRQEMLMDALEMLINEDIRSGRRGVEFHSVNPMFVAAWKKHGWAMVERARRAEQSEQSE